MTDLLFRQVLEAFTEDKAVLEAQQASLDVRCPAAHLDTVQDAGGLQARRILDRLIAAETAAANSTISAA
jgi:hypothetical protein